MKKKAMELSVNFLVILIMSLIVFGSGIALVNKFFAHAEVRQEQLDQETVSAIEELLNDGDMVAIPVNKKNFKIGDQKIFGVGIYNTEQDTKNFSVQVLCKNAYHLDGSKMVDGTGATADFDSDTLNEDWHFFNDTRNYTIDRNKYETVEVLIEASPKAGPGMSTKDGLYVFDVNVSLDGKLYDGHIHKLYVEVED